MRLSEIIPGLVLATLLDGKIKVQTSATKSHVVKAYAMNEMPTTGLGDEFMVVQANGRPDPKTTRRELWNGNLALAVYCKSNADGTIKPNHNASLIAQIEEIIGENGIRSGDFFFRLDENNPITPPTPNLTTGYYTTILNVWWRN